MSKKHYISAIALGLFIGLFLWIRIDMNKYDKARKAAEKKYEAHKKHIKSAGLSLATTQVLSLEKVKKAYDCEACYNGQTIRLYLLAGEADGIAHFRFELWIKELNKFHLYSSGACGFSSSDSSLLVLRGVLLAHKANYRFTKMDCHGQFVNPLVFEAHKFILDEASKFSMKSNVHELWVLKRTSSGWMDIQNQQLFNYNKKYSKGDSLKWDFKANQALPQNRFDYAYEMRKRAS